MDLDLIQTRIDHFIHKGYLTASANGKEYPLVPTTILVVLKVFSFVEHLHFPAVNQMEVKLFKEANYKEHLFVTPEGFRVFKLYTSNISQILFDALLPIFKNREKPATFVERNNYTIRNIKGEAGLNKTNKKDVNIQVHLLVDNNPPFEYLKTEYIFDTMYDARVFTNKLLTYIPPARLELWRLRWGKNGNQIKEPVELFIKDKPRQHRS